ncbi:MAG: NAD(P) transhydrogenase subunit alpha [Bacteroidota bacterium]|nr:NAD(P) transhydrogenase subunit alpha [Bacteroidota bacterium]
MEDLFNFLSTNEVLIYLLLFTILLGFEVISKVPSVLHTPLMSGANAISGIVILGAIILIRTTEPNDHFTLIIASLALLVGSINVFGGFFVTNRMLEMFNKKKKN